MRKFAFALLLIPALSLADALVPDPVKTPGDILTTDLERICTPGYTKTVRNVPQKLKRRVFAEYGIAGHYGDYEVDHLISLELGGSNSIKNLWPESFVTNPLNARLKDGLEHRLHHLVCSGQLNIVEAQAKIAGNWVQAYIEYVGPLPVKTANPD